MEMILKKYFTNINYFFFVFIIFLLLIEDLVNLTVTIKYIICFFLIATIGISHGAYDGHKGLIFLNKKIKFSKLLFYLTYISLVLFVFIISLFTFLDKFYESFGLISRIIIVVSDALVSISCILLLGYIMSLSLSGFKLSSVVLNFIKISFILFSTTQIILPLSKILPDLLFQFYPIFLAIFLIFYFGFVISFFMYFL